MSTHSKNNDDHDYPELSVEQKTSYKSKGKWPPQAGITILIEEEASVFAVLRLLSNLSRVVKPSQRKYIEQAKQQLENQS